MSAPEQLVFFVEDDDELRLATMQALELAGLPARAFGTAEEALAALGGMFDGVIVSDIRMPGIDGLELLTRVRGIDPDIPLILVTGHGDVAMAVQALKLGAYDFLTKPFASDHLLAVIRHALERRALQIENRRLRAAAEASDASSPLIGASVAMARLRALVRELAAADVDVLVEGESGVGKEVVAQLLHRLGPRAGRAFIPVNCAASNEPDFEPALFGSAGAPGCPAQPGRIAAANGGTLLLDEIDGLPLALQARLLRVLEERELQGPGAARPEIVNLRVVATTKVDLDDAVARGAFRLDLLHRLAATRLSVPPLRERDDDVVLLFDHFAREASERFGRAAIEPDPSALHRLRAQDWPGNVRELRNHATALVLGREEAVATADGRPTLKDRLADFERAAIRDALRQSGGNIGETIERLGLARKTFYDRVERLAIDLKAERLRSRAVSGSPV